MKRPKSQSKEPAASGSSESTVAPIQLVEVFQNAVKASKPQPELSREAIAVELLVIAGIASFEAMNRLDDLSQSIDREGESPFPLDRWEVELACQSWFEAASILRNRMDSLKWNGYESDSFAKFSDAYNNADEIVMEARERDRLERQALRTGELAALVAKLKPRQEVYDEERTGD